MAHQGIQNQKFKILLNKKELSNNQDSSTIVSTQRLLGLIDTDNTTNEEPNRKKRKMYPESRTDPDGESDGKEDDAAMPRPVELPKGFFDDPKADAKIRNNPYKDPIDEEMDLFKKAIAEESYKAQTMVEESLEEINIDRDFDEIEDQYNKWAKVNELEKMKAEKLKAKLASGSRDSYINDISEEDLDLADINVFSKWRAKSIELNSRVYS